MRQVLFVCNRSTLVADADLDRVVAAIQRQVTEHFFPVWNVDAELRAVRAGETAPAAGEWRIDLVDTSTDAGALGEHEYSTAPDGFAAAKDAQDDGVPWSSVLSHEVLELLADPEACRLMQVGDSATPLEVCDAVEGAPYEIDGVAVENFVYPSYFLCTPGAARYDHQAVLRGPAPSLAPGGYQYTSTLGDWKQQTAEHVREAKRQPPHPLSRRGRRAARPSPLPAGRSER